MYIRIYVYMCVGIYVYMCVGIYVYMCVGIYVYVYIYMCIYVHKNMYVFLWTVVNGFGRRPCNHVPCKEMGDPWFTTYTHIS